MFAIKTQATTIQSSMPQSSQDTKQKREVEPQSQEAQDQTVHRRCICISTANFSNRGHILNVIQPLPHADDIQPQHHPQQQLQQPDGDHQPTDDLSMNKSRLRPALNMHPEINQEVKNEFTPVVDQQDDSMLTNTDPTQSLEAAFHGLGSNLFAAAHSLMTPGDLVRLVPTQVLSLPRETYVVTVKLSSRLEQFLFVIMVQG